MDSSFRTAIGITLHVLSYFEEKLPILKYVKNNNVKWQQAFMKLNSRNSFIEQLNITAYPTVVLLDKRGEIKFVGAGDKSSLELIAKIIKK